MSCATEDWRYYVSGKPGLQRHWRLPYRLIRYALKIRGCFLCRKRLPIWPCQGDLPVVPLQTVQISAGHAGNVMAPFGLRSQAEIYMDVEAATCAPQIYLRYE